MVTINSPLTIPQSPTSNAASPVASEHSGVHSPDRCTISPATLSALAALTLHEIVDQAIDGCIKNKKTAAELTCDLKKGVSVQDTFKAEHFKPDFRQASIENLLELAAAASEAQVLVKELYAEIEKELLANPRKFSEASVDHLVKLASLFDKAGLLSAELAQAIKGEILFKDASKLRSADAKCIAALLDVYSQKERIDSAFLLTIQRALFSDHGKKMWQGMHKDLSSIVFNFRRTQHEDRDFYAAIQAIIYSKMRYGN